MAAAANTKIFTTVCAFGHIEASGTGKNKKESKQRAADLIIPKIVAEFGDPITYKASKKSKKWKKWKTKKNLGLDNKIPLQFCSKGLSQDQRNLIGSPFQISDVKWRQTKMISV